MILNYADIDKKTIALIGRYQHDLKNVFFSKEEKKANIKKKGKFEFSYRKNQFVEIKYNDKLRMSFMTAHQSKGLEYDIVILINNKNGKYGFPNQIVDDGVLDLILNQSEQYEHAEERRLYYVAITRAKERCIFLIKENNKSKFVHELEIEYQDKCRTY